MTTPEGPTATVRFVSGFNVDSFGDPRYDYETKFGPRKSMWTSSYDMADLGWEYLGWDRFDEHEEEYFRKLKSISALTSSLPSGYASGMIATPISTPTRLFNVQAVVIRQVAKTVLPTDHSGPAITDFEFDSVPTVVSAYLISTDMKSAMADFEIEFGEVFEWQVVTGSEQVAVIGRSVLDTL